jgi:cytochrome c biogenesis protein CcdA/thiol-disulfide isomerase/thioredoxin
MTPLLVFFAFLLGIATVVSPCVLPVLPMLLSTSVGSGRLRPLGVVLGLTASFTAATLIAATAVQALAVPVIWLRWVAVVALGLLGLTLLLPAWGRTVERLLSPLARVAGGGQQRTGFGGGLLMGAGLGLLWAPCAGPVMGVVFTLGVTYGVSAATAGITLAYALGAAIPMLVIGYGARGLAARAKRLNPYAEGVRRAFGALTVLMALALLFGWEGRLQALVPTELYNNLTTFERQESVQKELDKLETQAQNNPAGGDGSFANAPTERPALPAATAAPQATATAVPPTSTAIPATATAQPGLALKDLGPAPELTGITGWLNSEPLTLEGLRGKVVIVDFWTFGCYNCRNTRPHVRALYDRYRSQGLEIIGVHTPEFAHERVPENVREAAGEQGVTWPIALDPDFKTWRAFSNRYWPAFYFIDANGRLRHKHFGEGNYEYNEQVVQQLLAEARTASSR